ncbi:MAG: GTP-binding protein TypA/BipA [Syntrophorhabdaceae bacterium PtaU1.Bin034]|nr:MAG: GTP-binding protein TypA/BipA [Syntrophorhabdaceae bacterium PtaU1.Bin034]
MHQEKIRNIAIIAHVDHGKTTLVDQLFRQSGLFRDNQVVEERLMDSMDLERERGITITSKNGSFQYKGYLVNIVDTPGHADFGGQVERVLKMADGVLLLVDAAEGPMPQTYFVLKKALALKLRVIVVINKIDKPAARCDSVVDEVFDLFVKLDAPDHILDFPVIFASAKDGYATHDHTEKSGTMMPLFDMIVESIPAPRGDAAGPLQMLVSSLSYSPFLGRLAIGKITSGKLHIDKDVVVAAPGTAPKPARITKIYRFKGTEKVETDGAGVGEIVAVAGMESIMIGETLTDPLNPIPLEGIKVDPPTVSMSFVPNDSPFYGKEGRFVTSRHLRDRLFRETLSDVALLVEELEDAQGYKVSGRGELHLSILIEKMRREGYEFQVTRPQVIFREEGGKRLEPYEELTVDVDENYMGRVIENLGGRKGVLLEMHQNNGMARLRYRIPTRGLLGFRSEFLTETRGMGVMNYVFLEFGEYAGEIKNRTKGVMIAMDQCTTVAYALFNLQERGRLFLGPGEKVYEGQIIGEHSRDTDLVVNPAKGKKLTNMRASGSDDAVILTPHVKMTLEECISYINDDELVEITPVSIRLRKQILADLERRRAKPAA